MAWRYTATKKGKLTRKGAAQKKEALEKEVKRLREDGYKVRLYKVR